MDFLWPTIVSPNPETWVGHAGKPCLGSRVLAAWSLRAQGQARWPRAGWVSAEALCGRQKGSPRGPWASRWLSGRESACQCRRHEFDPWVRKIPWKKKWRPTPVFLSGKSHGQRSLAGYSRTWLDN